MDVAYLAIGGTVLTIALVAGRIERAPVSPPLLAMLAGVVLGPLMTGVLELSDTGPGSALLHELSRATLAVSLVAIALRFPVATFRRSVPHVVWLLAVALPVMAAVGTLVAAATLGTGLAVAAALGVALSPTDPVLASSVIDGEPARRHVPPDARRDLSAESGANDALAAPLVLLAGSAAVGTLGAGTGLDALAGLAGAIVLGIATGSLAGAALDAAERHHTTSRTQTATFSLVLALVAIGLGGVTGTDALVLAFVAGLAFNHRISADDRAAEELIDDSVHRLLVLPLFVVLGLQLPVEGWRSLGWPGVALVVGFLLLRRLPVVWLLRRRLDQDRPTAAWFGWFGPIGVAAVLYLTELHHLGVRDPIVWHAGSAVIVASTMVHGVTSGPGVAWLVRSAGAGRWPARAPQDEP